MAMRFHRYLLWIHFLIPLAAHAQQYSWSNFAGTPGASGSNDGSATAARFYNPKQLAIDAQGNVFVAGGSRVRKISKWGAVTTLPEPTFPVWGIAVDSANNLYFSSADRHTIHKMNKLGSISVLAGSDGQSGSDDGIGLAARFSEPRGIALDSKGNLLIADFNNHTLRKLAQDGTVTTVAGRAGQRGGDNGAGSVSRLDTPSGVATDQNDNIYVVEWYAHRVRKVDAQGMVTNLLTSQLLYPHGVSTDVSGNVFVADSQNYRIQKIVTSTGGTVVVGGNGSQGNVDGVGSAARFNYPFGVAVDRSGNLFVADTDNHRISRGVPIGPYLAAQPATNIAVTSAILNGSVNPSGYPTTAWFEYGPTTAYGTTVGVAISPADGTATQNVTAQITGLLPATTYYFRLTGTSSESAGFSESLTFKTLAGVPEIEVEQPAGTLLLNGLSAVDFGGAPISGSSVRTFTIRNAGTASLTGLSISRTGAHASNFSIGSLGSNTLAAGATRTFSVSFSPNAAGQRTALLRIASNDADENPFDIALEGTGLAGDIQIEQPSGGVLVNGFSTIDFGIVPPGNQVTQTFGVRNTGTIDLTGITPSLTGLNASDYTITRLPPAVLSPGSSASFTVRFLARIPNAPSATLRIVSNDPDENPFDIILTGKALGEEIALEQPAGRNLIDGADMVDLGSIAIGKPVIRNFRLRNLGNLALTGVVATITGTNSSDFAFASIPPDTIAPGTSIDFGVRFIAGGIGSRMAQLSITSSDSDENPFEVALIATGLSLPEDWRLGYFGLIANEGVAADTADPDGDGLVNLVEYALGGNPLSASSAPIPAVGMDAASGKLELKFYRFTDRTDLTLTVEGADSLAGTWTGLARSSGGDAFVALIGGIAVFESGTGVGRAVVAIDQSVASSSLRRFLRLRVTRQ
jgi:sugar lactone lactonase YvrE